MNDAQAQVARSAAKASGIACVAVDLKVGRVQNSSLAQVKGAGSAAANVGSGHSAAIALDVRPVLKNARARNLERVPTVAKGSNAANGQVIQHGPAALEKGEQANGASDRPLVTSGISARAFHAADQNPPAAQDRVKVSSPVPGEKDESLLQAGVRNGMFPVSQDCVVPSEHGAQNGNHRVPVRAVCS